MKEFASVALKIVFCRRNPIWGQIVINRCIQPEFDFCKFLISFSKFLIVMENLRKTHSGIKLEKINKGRIWPDLRDIWRIFGEILPSQKSKENTRKNQRKAKKHLCFTSFPHLFFNLIPVIRNLQKPNKK